MAHAAETSTHRITLDFEDAETLALALEHIGDRDAPVMITGGTVTAGGATYQLWAGYTPHCVPSRRRTTRRPPAT